MTIRQLGRSLSHERLVSAVAAIMAAIAPARATSPTEVMHFWVSGSERAALDVIRDSFVRRGGVWVDNPQNSALELRRVLSDRLTTGTAPTALHWHAGSELREMAEIGLVDNYDALAAREHWDDVLPPPIKSRIMLDGHYFLAPTGVHSDNWIFYNVKLLAERGIAPPTTMAELLAAITRLEADGITPIAVGRSGWEDVTMFASTLLSALGREDFRRLFQERDLSVLDQAKTREAITLFYTLGSHLLPEARRPAGWAEATADVGAGRAAFIFQGDWAKGELLKLGYRLGSDFGCLLVPGTENTLTTVVDTFAFPRSLDAPNLAERDRLIETIYDPEVQVDFNRIKGSIPPRSDVPENRLDACAAIAHRILNTPGGAISPAAHALPTAMVSDLEVLVGRMIRDPAFTPDQALANLRSIFGPDAASP